MAILHVGDSDFASVVLQSKVPVLVDFYADWCGPCKRMAPILEALSETAGDKLSFCKLNVDDAPAVSMQFGVQSIPTLILFENGSETKRLIGLQPPNVLQNWLNL